VRTMVFAFVLQWSFCGFLGLNWVGFCYLGVLAIVQIIVRIVRDCTGKRAVECVSDGLLTIRLLE
jgi:hypothetical protein